MLHDTVGYVEMIEDTRKQNRMRNGCSGKIRLSMIHSVPFLPALRFVLVTEVTSKTSVTSRISLDTAPLRCVAQIKHTMHDTSRPTHSSHTVR
jgi:hypothetical protein